MYKKGPGQEPAPLSEANLNKYVVKQTKGKGKGKRKGKRETRRLKIQRRHPIKMVIPPWIDKKYIKNGRVDWAAYSK